MLLIHPRARRRARSGDQIDGASTAGWAIDGASPGASLCQWPNHACTRSLLTTRTIPTSTRYTIAPVAHACTAGKPMFVEPNPSSPGINPAVYAPRPDPATSATIAGQFARAVSDHDGTRCMRRLIPYSRGTMNRSMAMIVLATGIVTAPIPVTIVNVLVRFGMMNVMAAAIRPRPTTVYWRRHHLMPDSRFCAPLMAMYKLPS